MRRRVARRAALHMALSLASSVPAWAQGVDGVRGVVADYSRRVIAGDIDGVVARTNHLLVDDLGGAAGARAWLSEQYRRLRAEGAMPLAERIDRIRDYHDEAIDLYFVETTRSFDGFPRPVRSTYLYLVDTRDKGRTWEVLDLACVNLAWLHAIAPSFKDDRAVSDILSR